MGSDEIPRVLLDRFFAKVAKGEGCWHWSGHVNRSGYGRFNFGPKKLNAHRASYLIHCGPIPDGMVVRHRCDNRRCVRPDHLEIGTSADNTRDMVLRGRATKWNGARRGSKNPSAKLTEQDVVEIKALLKRQMNKRAIAAQFGVSKGTIYYIWKEKLWPHV